MICGGSVSLSLEDLLNVSVVNKLDVGSVVKTLTKSMVMSNNSNLIVVLVMVYSSLLSDWLCDSNREDSSIDSPARLMKHHNSTTMLWVTYVLATISLNFIAKNFFSSSF